MYKYNADILPSSFDNFFSKLYNIHIMAQDNKFHGIFIINMLELIIVKVPVRLLNAEQHSQAQIFTI